MADATSTFSESWYRVSSQKVYIREGVRIRRQNFRGERWHVLENPFNNEYFRIRPEAYAFLARLSPDRTVGEAWQECLDENPDTAPGQEQVIQLLAQLYLANLLHYDSASDASELFSRYKKRRERELRAKLVNIMFMRFPLFDPDRFLVRTLPSIGRLFSLWGLLLWTVVVGYGLKLVADNFGALREESQSVLTPENLPLLYVGMILIKTLHEFGHAYVCRKFGGEVHVMGVMLMIFTPVPYVDATSSWSFRERWKRILVGGAGMIVEVFIAAIATVVWAKTSPGVLHNLAYNMMFVASVSTVIFNINPLLRFDGYYMLSDWLGIPNLSQRANKQLRYLSERFLFGIRKAQPPTTHRKEASWLVTYGITSGIYRVIVFGGILLAIGDHFFIIGLIMAAVCFVSWVTVPCWKFLKYLASDPKLDRTRPRAIAVSCAIALLLIVFFQFIPFPSHFRAPGIVQAQTWSEAITVSAGVIEEVPSKPGSRVRKGDLLARMSNRELELELQQAQAAVAETDARIRQSTSGGGVDVKPLQQRLAALTNRVEKLRSDLNGLSLVARHDGLWVAPELQDAKGRFVAKGVRLGLLADPSSFQFIATVPQEDGDALFARRILGGEIRMRGEAGDVIKAENWKPIPGAQRILPSPALGWRGGGEVPVAMDDPNGQRAAEPFFEVRADLAASEEALLLHGRSGRIRFQLESEPLLPRAVRRLRQLLQKRYQL
ncbi:MAG: biotin/lipoyl-binding protein [Verrucomicrobia bacterium]|nr:biotin/lipoyl-binding protein [Verrucomicrobiota bacterium]